MAETRVQKFNKRLKALDSERSAMMPYWQEVADYILAGRGQFLADGGNKGAQQPRWNTKQINNTPRLALRTLAAGMMAGITSPARPWFSLGAGDPDMNEHGAVKDWLDKVQKLMYRIFASSNTYNSLHQLYAELGAFGTGCLMVYENYDNVIHTKTETIGSYMLGAGRDGRIDTRYREFTLTVGQVVKEFGQDRCSQHVLNLWNNGGSETKIDLVHVVEPNDNRDEMSPLARDMAWRSVVYEKAYKNGDKLLRESGFGSFPGLAPRWDIAGEEVYGHESPGMMALGDSKALQVGEEDMYRAMQKVADPPLQADEKLRAALGDAAPESGRMYYTQQGAAQRGIESIYNNYQPRLDQIVAIQQRTEARINETFYKDLFLMLATSDRRQMTAREVAERHEEKLIMLGPVLERLHAELLDPLIDRTFEIMARTGVLPPPPREMQGAELQVEYISLLAQAQRLVGISALERTAGFAVQLAQLWPEARHKIDPLQMVDEYAANMGTPSRVIRPDDEVDEIMAAEAQAAAQAQAMAQQQAQANIAAELPMRGGTGQALTDAGLM